MTTQWEYDYIYREASGGTSTGRRMTESEMYMRDGAMTVGGEWVLIGGINFGTIGENAITSVSYCPTGE